METQMKVLLYLKRNEQKADGFCPLMGKITVSGKKNSIAQFACKINVNSHIWNSTSQRCTGKSNEAISTNREIESLLRVSGFSGWMVLTTDEVHFKNMLYLCAYEPR
jgi:hypothetical protein